MKNILLTLPLTLLAVGCLENEEEVTVLPDGSVRVTVRARGDLSDLAGGYPVPLEEPWGGGGGDTARWLAEVGASTGGPGLGAAVAGLDWPHEPDKEPQATLEAHAEFRSVDDWPRWTGPSAEPYRHSYLERSASLRVLERGARTVYVFERVFHARKRSSQELGAQVEEKLPEALRAKFEHEEFPTREEWPLVWTALRDVFQEASYKDWKPQTRASVCSTNRCGERLGIC